MDPDQAAVDGPPDLRTTRGRLDDLLRRIDEAIHAGSAAVQRQHEQGRRTARERIDLLLDEDSFTELGEFVGPGTAETGSRRYGDGRYGDGVVTGLGSIGDRPVCLFAQDVTIAGGSLGERHAAKIADLLDAALRTGCPVIGLFEGDGVRIQDGVGALSGLGDLLRRSSLLSGVVPQVAVIMGPTIGDQAQLPALADFVVMVDGAGQLIMTEPEVITTVTGTEITPEELGGGGTHATRSGIAHLLAEDEADALARVRTLLSYLPQNNLEDPPVFAAESEPEVTAADRELDLIIPDSPNVPYDSREVIIRLLDGGEFVELQDRFAANVVIGFGRIEGRSVGVVASQPLHLAGWLDGDASEKAARFVRSCDAFNLPVITLVDVPGFRPDHDQELRGIARRGAKLSYTYAEATVPLITVITRNAYGGGFVAMGSKPLGADLTLAWPTARIAVAGAQRAVERLHGAELTGAADADQLRAELITAYDTDVASPYPAAERGFVDAVISPHRTRAEVARALRVLRTKRETTPPRKHGTAPL